MLNCSLFDIKKICGYQNLSWTFQQSFGSSGVMITIWDKDFVEVIDSLVGDYTLSISCINKADNFEWVLTNVYGPNKPIERDDFWMKLDNASRLWDLPWCLGGDFNVILKCDEKKGCNKITKSMRYFANFIYTHDLIDLPMKGTASTVLWLKLKALKEKLKLWNKEVFGITNFKLNLILEEIQTIDVFAEDNILSGSLVNEKIKLKTEFEKVTKMEEISWKIKSNTKWLQEGDRNTSFFISQASSRRRANRIRQLYVNGELTTDRDKLKEHIVGYYENLFTEEEIIRPELWILSLNA
ncbi:uncharacterized protein LOC113316580 [Papaver somniferum]|uniref:uncharacterized protein LOC113316580 n=1 Tax=Papaver somniferum TaxID=3469 RepID=UPI000E7036ED|nr:uncharacterized protein LOC113316580 [Papaver somniferum]